MIKQELHKRILTTAILLPIVILMVLYNQASFNLLLILVLFFSFYEWYSLNKKKISISIILGYLIILIAILSAKYLRSENIQGIMIFLWIIFVCFFSDIGGFCFGKVIGGKKITKISRNKTYSGAFGSFIFSLIPILFLNIFDYEILKLSTLVLSWKYIILSLLFSLVCQIGDITVSYFKRLNKVKDTGKLLPGHGGLLDRIDGLIFVLIFSGVLKFFYII
tara:strand:+ start:375 stop:1037 length:663 start_codon:yes stop_codon:yes gene_type:complete